MSAATGPQGPGELFLGEIREQPEALLRLLEQEAEFEAVTKAMRERRPAVVRLVGHGSSDAAASYGVYAFGLLPGWTAMRDSISLTVYYDAKLDLSDSVVIALSQSGETPDVVEYVKRAREKGAFTVAITNGAESSLADSADATLALAAGPERAVAASKTFLNTLAALAWVAGGAAERGSEISEGLRRVSDQLSESLESLEQAVANVAMAFAYVGRMYVIGRGIEFGTAREVALKLTETCRVAAEPLTATDLAHGPDRGARLDVPGLDDRLARREPAGGARGRSAGARSGRDGGGERQCRPRDRRRGLRIARPGTAPPDPFPAPLGGAGPALCGRSGACEGARCRLSRGPEQGHARALTRLTKPIVAQSS